MRSILKLACAIALVAAPLVACGSNSDGNVVSSTDSPAATNSAGSSVTSNSADSSATSNSADSTSSAEATGSTETTGSDAPIAVTIANVAQNVTYMPLIAARELGYFEEEGLTVKYIEANTPVQDKAMLGGDLDFGTLNSGQVLAGNAVGDYFVTVASLSNVPVMSLYGTAGMTKVEDMAGKTVAVGAVGTASDIVARIIFTKYDMLDKVKLQPISGGGPSVLAALDKGLVDGAVFAPPSTEIADSRGFVRLLDGIDIGTKWLQSGVVTTKKFAAANPEAVRRVATATAKGWAFLADPANADKVLELITNNGVQPEFAKGAYDYLFKIWSTQKVPTVDLEAMQVALDFSPEGQKAGLKAADQFDNSFLPSD